MRVQRQRQTARHWLAAGALLAALLLLAIYALGRGSYPLSAAQVVAALAGGPAADDAAAHVLWSIRLPRLLAAVLAGMSLATAGVVMQTVLRNPLASPLTLGISQGAAMGATCGIVLLGAGELHRFGPQAITVHQP